MTDTGDTACPECGVRQRAVVSAPTYAYLLGIYLGDGHITQAARAQRLRVSSTKRYPRIIAETRTAMTVVSGRPTGLLWHHGHVEVSGWSKHWACVFPQHGPGPKHQRPIVLEAWQRDIVQEHPWMLLRGLTHSDGCRIVHTVAGHQYVRYFFTNNSADIHAIFRDACDLVGAHWTAPSWKNTSVARRDAIAAFDRFIGPKR
jgi:hypothetical protein